MSFIKKLVRGSKTIIEEYFDLQKEYESKFGEKTIVLYENGHFYEFYQVENEDTKLGRATEVCEILNIILTRKDKSIDVSLKNPQMAGFPSLAKERHVPVLLQNNYTVVLVEQITTPPNPERAVTSIISKDTYIEDINTNTNYIMCIITRDEVIKGSKVSIAGWCAVDLSTGKFLCDEIQPKVYVDNFSIFEEINKVAISIKPNTIIAYSLDSNIELLNLLEDAVKHKFNMLSIIPEKSVKIAHQNNTFEKTFSITGQISAIELLDLEYKELTRVSIMVLLDYINEHNPKLSEKLSKPISLNGGNYLQLENNTIEQLDIYTNKKDNLYNIIDFTQTKIGKRYLLFSLLNPITSIEELNNRYMIVKSMDYYKQLQSHFKTIIDIERIYRKIILGLINPNEILFLVKSLESFHTILNIIETNSGDKHFPIIELKNQIDEVQQFISDILNITNITTLNNRKEIITHIFNKNEESMELNNKILQQKSLLKELSNYLSMSYFKDNDSVKLERNEEGYFLKLTPKKGEQFEKKIKIDGDIQLRTYTFEPSLFKKDTRLKSFAKYTHEEITNVSREISQLEQELMELNYELFMEFCKEFCDTFDSNIKNICKWIGLIDFYKSGKELEEKYKYTYPIINETKDSYILAKDLRHPIVERISDKEYITNDIDLSKEKGYLIFGINGIGKSIYMKSVGVNIILAQIGYPVAASYFEFNPYTKIMTRIISNDNLYKGYSSFMVEMIELKRILENADNKTIILADELTHGTEIQSGTAIITAAIIELIKANSNFVFTSHLHNLVNIKYIKDLKSKLKIYHMKIIYDEENDELIYNRKLIEGPGEPLYGIECCKGLHLKKEFLSLATKIRKEIMNEKDKKSSRYNEKLIVDNCYICDTDFELHTHHIVEQYTADKDGFIGIFHKNNIHNLVVLCEKCHKKVHKGEIEIVGWKFTNMGNKLEYKIK